MQRAPGGRPFAFAAGAREGRSQPVFGILVPVIYALAAAGMAMLLLRNVFDRSWAVALICGAMLFLAVGSVIFATLHAGY